MRIYIFANSFSGSGGTVDSKLISEISANELDVYEIPTEHIEYMEYAHNYLGRDDCFFACTDKAGKNVVSRYNQHDYFWAPINL